MTTTAKIEITQGGILSNIREFLKKVLQTEEINAMLVPQHLQSKNVIMPVLITDPEQINSADPLSPAFPLNAANLVSRLTRKQAGGKIAAVLRPCEIRAFIELVKLNQGSTDELVIIGVDCFGAYSNNDYRRFAAENSSDLPTTINSENLSSACKACEHPIPYGADILIGLFGVETNKNLLVQALTPKGESLLKLIKLPEWEEPEDRKTAIDALIAEKKAYRDKMFAQTSEETNNLDKLTEYLSGCVNCYNCRVACPVCYCKECVFVTDVFKHEPAQYLQWASRKGAVKMPTDTLFYHLTRLAHMSTACVGCGQCSNVCPNDIKVMELFRTVAHRTQKAFDYEAGRSFDEAPPLSEFREKEFPEVVGIK
ncbi:MAG: 4Fe-4S dicluster domain-containing protein [Desulfamplus sp.]